MPYRYPMGGEWDTTVPGVNTSANVFISSATGIGQLVMDIKKSYRYLYRYDFDLVAKIPVPKSGKYL